MRTIFPVTTIQNPWFGGDGGTGGVATRMSNLEYFINEIDLK